MGSAVWLTATNWTDWFRGVPSASFSVAHSATMKRLVAAVVIGARIGQGGAALTGGAIVFGHLMHEDIHRHRHGQQGLAEAVVDHEGVVDRLDDIGSADGQRLVRRLERELVAVVGQRALIVMIEAVEADARRRGGDAGDRRRLGRIGGELGGGRSAAAHEGAEGNSAMIIAAAAVAGRGAAPRQGEAQGADVDDALGAKRARPVGSPRRTSPERRRRRPPRGDLQRPRSPSQRDTRSRADATAT